MTEANVEQIDLILDNGGVIEIQFPEDQMDDVTEDIRQAIQRKALWSPEGFVDCVAYYLGTPVDEINMARVVAKN